MLILRPGMEALLEPEVTRLLSEVRLVGDCRQPGGWVGLCEAPGRIKLVVSW